VVPASPSMKTFVVMTSPVYFLGSDTKRARP
jgi:hypothetical protein